MRRWGTLNTKPCLWHWTPIIFNSLDILTLSLGRQTADQEWKGNSEPDTSQHELSGAGRQAAGRPLHRLGDVQPGAALRGRRGEAEGDDGRAGGGPREDEGSARVDHQDLCCRLQSSEEWRKNLFLVHLCKNNKNKRQDIDGTFICFIRIKDIT